MVPTCPMNRLPTTSEWWLNHGHVIHPVLPQPTYTSYTVLISLTFSLLWLCTSPWGRFQGTNSISTRIRALIVTLHFSTVKVCDTVAFSWEVAMVAEINYTGWLALCVIRYFSKYCLIGWLDYSISPEKINAADHETSYGIIDPSTISLVPVMLPIETFSDSTSATWHVTVPRSRKLAFSGPQKRCTVTPTKKNTRAPTLLAAAFFIELRAFPGPAPILLLGTSLYVYTPRPAVRNFICIIGERVFRGAVDEVGR